MNRLEFGMLVASLREDLRWTQAELAEKSHLDVSVISNIERGAKRILSDDLLLNLADGLLLNTMERQEFLFAANGVDEAAVVRKEPPLAKARFNPEAFLKETGEHIGSIPSPVLVTDSFCDVLLANHCALEYYDTPKSLMNSIDASVDGYNMMRYVFHAKSTFQEAANFNLWEALALVNMRYFRRRTMRVRHKPYFAALLRELLTNHANYPSFERYWRKMLFESIDYYSVPMGKHPPEDANAIVGVETHFAVTPYGELFWQQIVPKNKKTARRFEKIMERVGEGYQRFAPFPDARKK
jgi:transcriptional regulator with XRE-family HTH domain